MRLAERLMAPLLDGLLISASLWLLPVLAAAFAAPHWSGVLLVTLAYLGLCAGMWLLKLIEPPAGATPSLTLPWRRTAGVEDGGGCLGFLSMVFAVITLAMLLGALGMVMGSPQARVWLGYPEHHPWLFSGLIIIMVAWVLLLPLVAGARPRPMLKPGSAAALGARAAGVLAVNAMLLLATAWGQATLGAAPAGWAPGLRVLLAVSGYAVLLLCSAPSRLTVFALDGDRLSLATLLLALGFLVWPLMR